mmetsp:Transcript_15484/g.30905  ORF Transcript_15484/g.30905 Transcript_15484/m.30905 type:complete len:248 (+) Transcript_15484:513-1256(+)
MKLCKLALRVLFGDAPLRAFRIASSPWRVWTTSFWCRADGLFFGVVLLLSLPNPNDTGLSTAICTSLSLTLLPSINISSFSSSSSSVSSTKSPSSLSSCCTLSCASFFASFSASTSILRVLILALMPTIFSLSTVMSSLFCRMASLSIMALPCSDVWKETEFPWRKTAYSFQRASPNCLRRAIRFSSSFIFSWVEPWLRLMRARFRVFGGSMVGTTNLCLLALDTARWSPTRDERMLDPFTWGEVAE